MGKLIVGPLDACTKKQKGNYVGPGNTGLVPAPPPPAGPKGIPVPTVVKIDTGSPKSAKTPKVKHNGGDANNEKTIFKGTMGDPMHVGDLPPSTPKKDIISWVKENEGYTVKGHPTASAQKKGFVMATAPAIGNTDGKKGQIPVVWLAAGGSDMFDAACRAAMIKCGIDPDSFGSYKDVAKAQSDARAQWEKDMETAHGSDRSTWPDPASQAELDRMAAQGRAGEWLAMNSQSGHLIQNNFFQGDRNNARACSNHPPTYQTSGSPPRTTCTSTGGYGYDGEAALCSHHMAGTRMREGADGVDHCSSVRRGGHEHQEICNSEAAQRRDIRAAGGTVGTADIARNADETAGIMANGSRSNSPAALQPGTPEAERAALNDRAREHTAAELQKKQGTAGSAGGASGANGGPGNSASNGATAADRQKAAECISAAAQQALNGQRAECMASATQNGPAGAAARQSVLDDYNRRNPPGVQNFDQLPPEVQGLAPSRQRQMDLAAQGAAGPTAGANGAPPTQEQCLEYQANVLYQEGVFAGGAMPPMGGQVGSPPPAAPGGAGSVGGGGGPTAV